LFTVDMPRPKKVLKEIQTRKTRSIDRNAFSAALVDSLSPDAFLSLSCAEACTVYDDTVRRLIDTFAPANKVSITIRPDAPWFNYDVRAARRALRKAETHWKASKLTVHHDIMKAKRNELTTVRRRAKFAYYSDKINATASPEDFRPVAPSRRSCPPNDSSPRNDTSPNQHLANEFANYFDSKITSIRACINANPIGPPSDNAELTQMPELRARPPSRK
jgi:hypothetical protein